MKNGHCQKAASRKISVVIASIVGPPFIDKCIRSIQAEVFELDAEVIVITCGAREYAKRVESVFPWVRVVHCAGRETVPELRRRGVQSAQGEFVAIIEEHCVASGGGRLPIMLIAVCVIGWCTTVNTMDTYHRFTEVKVAILMAQISLTNAKS
jgi:hypothetical protein